MIFLMLTIAEILYSSSLVQSLCPDNWVSHEGGCYAFVTDIKSTWIDAGAFCRNAGAKLVEIERVEERNFLRSHVIAFHKSEHFWIGGSDAIKDGKWVWVSTQEPFVYTDWAPREPRNGINAACITMAYHQGYHWNDDNCTVQYDFICERTAICRKGLLFVHGSIAITHEELQGFGLVFTAERAYMNQHQLRQLPNYISSG